MGRHRTPGAATYHRSESAAGNVSTVIGASRRTVGASNSGTAPAFGSRRRPEIACDPNYRRPEIAYAASGRRLEDGYAAVFADSRPAAAINDIDGGTL